MSDSATETGPSCSGGLPYMRAPPPVINIIAPSDSPNTNNNVEPGPSGENHSQHSVASASDMLSSCVLGPGDNFKCDFSNWSSETSKGFTLGGAVASSARGAGGPSLSTLQVQQPYLDLEYAISPNNNELTEFHGKIKKRRLRCRRGAVVLQRSPVGRYFQGERKLRLAAQQGEYHEVLRLLDEGINPNRGDDRGRTALHFAITKGFRDIVQLLLDRGADVNQKDGIGNTPLHLAAIGSHISMVTTLLQAGANVQVLDRGGHTPFHLALSRLQHLRTNPSLEGIQFRQEILQIMGMLRVYVSCRGQQENAMQLEQMSAKLKETERKEEVDLLQDMLEGFTKMNLTKQ
ncbi:ankyrin repeat domain-containing protein 54-like [Diadema setosum]|uniref:ankyrin repeat domain-containing protein 54-like n=1 Tax=Diadema setosum TaxID=31175 RepID=UPI003B3B7D65